MGGYSRNVDKSAMDQVHVSVELQTKNHHKLEKARIERLHSLMRSHINFKEPKLPKEINIESAVTYAIDRAIAIISPKQEPNEDNNFECVDIIAVLKNELLPEIIKDINSAIEHKSYV